MRTKLHVRYMVDFAETENRLIFRMSPSVLKQSRDGYEDSWIGAQDNQHNDLSAQRILLSAWTSEEFDQSTSVRRKWIFGSPLSAQQKMPVPVTR